MSQDPHTNRLIHEKSPYLLQHAHNPVDWYPWGEEAFARARREDKPIFLSVGYSTCHWCHVMERECFENEEIAAVMNELFVCIKVDREERPDVDNVYMDAVQAMTGSGGWPMSVWLTPDLKPYYAGTYFPPVARGGMPGFVDVCRRLHAAWTERRGEVLEAAQQIQEHLTTNAKSFVSQGKVVLDSAFVDKAYAHVEGSYDARKGGFGRAPKFPTPHKVRFLLRYYHRTGEKQALTMALHTLDEMAMGGIHDHLGGGFHRYSTDADWLVPHFEKMLYDQAGLALAYTDAFRVTGERRYERVLRDICDYVLRDLTDPAGGFYSAEDADSEGEEGKFYVWTAAEIREVLGEETGNGFLEAYRSSDAGNWESVNILHTATTESLADDRWAEARESLLEARSRRVRPHLDDKIITAWNGFMIEALAEAGRALDEPRYLEAAAKAEAFIHDNLVSEGRLLRAHRQGPADIKGYLDDYAFLARGCFALYQATFEPEYLERARDLCRDMVRLFHRNEGGFSTVAADQDTLIAPVIEIYDGAMPSGNSAAASALLRVGHLTADAPLKDAGWETVKLFSGTLDRGPSAFMEMISAADFALGPVTEVIVAAGSAEELEPFLQVVNAGFRPNTVTAATTAQNREAAVALIPYLESQGVLDGKPTAYVCRNYACRLPVHTPTAMKEDLQSP